MICNRISGISNLVTVCQGLLTLALFWLWLAVYRVAVSGAEGTDLGVYLGYSLIIVFGLFLDSALHSPACVPFPVRRQSFILQAPHALRRTAIAIGFLFFIMVLGKDRSLSRLFFFTFIPFFYVLLLATGHLLPGLFGRSLFRGRRAERLILIGSPKRAAAVRECLLAKQEYGFCAVGILTDDLNYPNTWPKVLGPPSQLDAMLQEHAITQVILLQPPEAISDFAEVRETIYKRGIRLTILNNLDEQLHHPYSPLKTTV